jgi:hypothetical protein
LRAAGSGLPALAAAGEKTRAARLERGECAANSATVGIVWAGSGAGLDSPDQVHVDMDAGGAVHWASGQYGQLAVDGTTQLDLAAALDAVAAVCARAVLGTAAP